MNRFTIDFDADTWMMPLRKELGDLLPNDIEAVLRSAAPKFVEDARDILYRASSDPETLIDRSIDWVKGSDVLAFHGTRLTDIEANKLWQSGLRALDIQDRIDWIFRTVPDLADALAQHEAIKLAHSHSMGNRGGQVHLAISRQFTQLGYDYHREGSEFDRRLLQFAGLDHLLPQLTQRGRSWLVSIRLSGGQALDGMHPFFPIEYTRENDRYPNLVRELLEELAWQMHRPGSPRRPIDSCFMLRASLPGSSVEAVEPI
ncbi:hypothetical protein [Mesorhizobium sp. M1227]|uniref:hypothetical protein n=1 Tax=unclassified Mesorhizobium TaxID=325217 RepID=UPI003334F250